METRRAYDFDELEKAVKSFQISEQNSNTDELFQRPAALADVDGTLVKMGQKTEKTSLTNESVIAALKACGIKDIFLFTNMGLDTLQNELSTDSNRIPMSRVELVQYLEKHGFTVHLVMTPADVGYAVEHPEEDPLGHFYSKIYLKHFWTAKYKDFFEEKGALINDIQKVGIYKNKAFEENAKLLDVLDPEKTASFNIKAIMFNLFLKHKPKWVSLIVNLDDEESCHRSVQLVHQKLFKDIPLISIDVTQSPHDTFDIEHQVENKNYYVKTINSQLTIQQSRKIHHLPFYRIHFVYDLILQLQKSYAELEHGLFSKKTFVDDIEILRQSLERIMTQNDETDEAKFNLMLVELEQTFKQTFQKKKFLGSSHHFDPDLFVNLLNVKEKGKHHYTRLLALMLSDVYSLLVTNNVDNNISDKKLNINPLVNMTKRILPGEHKAYQAWKDIGNQLRLD